MKKYRLSGNNLRRIVAETTARVLAEAANPQYRGQIAQTGRTQNSMADDYNQSKGDMINDYYNFQNQSRQDYNQFQQQAKGQRSQGGGQANQNSTCSYEDWARRNEKIKKLREMGVFKDDYEEMLARKKYGVPPTYEYVTNPNMTF